LYSIAFGTDTKTAEPIEMPFGIMGVQIPQREGAIFGVVRAIQKHWQSSAQPSLPRSLQKRIQSPITSFSQRDHSVRQASAN